MLNKVSLKNFKAHKDTTIEAVKVNVFIGPNNSGKSSVFQAMMALKQAARRGDRVFLQSVPRVRMKDDPTRFMPPEALVDLGDFDSVLRTRSEELTISASGVSPVNEPYAFHDPIDVRFDIHIRENIIDHQGGRLGLANSEVRWLFAKGQANQSQPKVRIGGVTFTFRIEDNFQLLTFAGAAAQPGASPQEQSGAVRFGNYLAWTPVRLLDSLRMIYPLRGLEEWGFPLPDQPAKYLEAVTLEERTMATAGRLAYDSECVEALSKHFESLFDFKLKVVLLPGRRLTFQVRDTRRTANDTLLSNEGTGATQLPFILVPMMLANEGDSVLVCEPEAHLHPKAQSQVMSRILEIAKHRNLQLFIETHSEHILHKLLHTVAKGELAKEDLAIYYFSVKDDAASAERLEVDDTGGVKGGLPGFFDQSLDELEEYLGALKGAKT